MPLEAWPCGSRSGAPACPASLSLPSGVLGYSQQGSTTSGACCDPSNTASYLGTRQAQHISSFVEFYQVNISLCYLCHSHHFFSLLFLFDL